MTTFFVKNPAQDHPINECRAVAHKLIESGATIWQKFSCEQCNSREIAKEPNVFYPFGECSVCGHVTNLVDRGCNYAVAMPLRR